MTLSPRASRLLHEPSPLIQAHFRCAADPFDPVERPGGYVNFGTAEHHLLWDLVGPRLALTPPLRASDAHYGMLFGTPALRGALAEHLSPLAGRPLDPERIVVGAGTSAILNHLAHALLEPGEAVLVSAPYYSGFDHDLAGPAGAVLVPVPTSAADGFRPTVAALEAALLGAREAGLRVKAALVTNPGNPVGTALDAPAVAAIAAWLAHHDLQGIFDEIYARTDFGGRFGSALALPPALRSRVHVVHGFAKDFGLSGFKVGLVYSEDEQLVAAMRELSLFAPVSTHTQAAIAAMIADRDWVERTLETGRRRLAAAFARLASRLGAAGIPVAPGEAGVFAWLDLRAFLAEPTFEAEARLFTRCFEEARVSVTPGAAFHMAEPGWFRLCFAWPDAVLDEGLERLIACLRPSEA